MGYTCVEARIVVTLGVYRQFNNIDYFTAKAPIFFSIVTKIVRMLNFLTFYSSISVNDMFAAIEGYPQKYRDGINLIGSPNRLQKDCHFQQLRAQRPSLKMRTPYQLDRIFDLRLEGCQSG